MPSPAFAAMPTARRSWADLTEDPSSSSSSNNAVDISGESASRLHLEETSYGSQISEGAASNIGNQMAKATAFSGKEPLAENVPPVKKARKNNDSERNDVSVALGAADHKAGSSRDVPQDKIQIAQRWVDDPDFTAAGSSRDSPQDKIAHLRQMFEGVPEDVLKVHLESNGGSIEKVVDSFERLKALEKQAKQKQNAAQASGDAAKHREEKPWKKEGRHWIINNTKKRRDKIDYLAFNAMRPREVRDPEREPMTPDPREVMSKRGFEDTIRRWKNKLDKWTSDNGKAIAWASRSEPNLCLIGG